ncbi:MAG: S8 family serine peptidase [Bryobacteraceae bacterium]
MLARSITALFVLVVSSAAWCASVQTMPNHYTLLLEDPPVAERFHTSTGLRTQEAGGYRAQIEGKQRALREELGKRGIRVTSSVTTVLNALFVIAPKERLAELKGLPGVKGVVPARRYHKDLSHAIRLLNAPGAWNVVGGIQNAGAGIKIAILDSGIDQTHPAFQDSSLPMPSGFPICSGSDCAYTNNKVIVARSYVRQLAAGTAPNPAADSRPDDYSPRDRDGHGTAVASCAAGEQNTGLMTFSGFAPKAYLGNYKIYGSPGLNDSASDDVVIQALEDAYQDGMDIINFSSGSPAFSGPLDSGAACGNAAGVPCDLLAQTFETMAQRGVIIVAAAGNEGYDGVNPNSATYSSISSPGDAPSVITVGAVTNSHTFAEVVRAAGPEAPSNLQNIQAAPGDASVPLGSVTGNLIDVTNIGDDGFACSALPAASLVGAIALVERGNCDFSVKLGNTKDAGAIGTVFYMADSSPIISPSQNLYTFGIPAAMISNADGVALKNYTAATAAPRLTISGAGNEQSGKPDQVGYFSSVGPTTGDGALKPDLLAVGTSVYMAGESYDSAGALYSSDGYLAGNGTSFATPMVAGTAALVKQQHPGYTAEQVKSALSNTAAPTVLTDDSGNPVDVRSTGAGLMDAGAAVNATVTAVPSSVSFGVLGSLPKTQPLQLTNSGTAPVTLSVSVSVQATSSGASVQVDTSGLVLNPGASGTINVLLSGSVPGAGSYSGAIMIQGSGVSLQVPYLYLVGSGSAANLIPLTGVSFDGTVNGSIPDGIVSFKLVDPSGIPVVGEAVVFSAQGGAIQSADSVTDQYGIATAVPVLGPQSGNVTFTATAGGLRADFTGYARPQPLIPTGAVVDGASFQANSPVAPGSYISIFGSGLSDFIGYSESSTLPLQIDYAYVSFDVPSAGISVPGHLVYVSPGQVNLQVPWELQGQSSAQVKVSIDYSNGNVVTLPLAPYAPSIFKIAGGMAAALDQSFAVVGAANPIARGQVVQLYANGLGPVSNQPASGAPAPSVPLAETPNKPAVSIGGQSATVLFSGLAPGFAGLYQVNAIVPAGINPGIQPVVISIGGFSSNPVNLAVQ